MHIENICSDTTGTVVPSMWYERIQTCCSWTLLTFVSGFTLEAALVLQDENVLCCMTTTSKARCHECAVFCRMLFGIYDCFCSLFLRKYWRERFGISLAADILPVPPFFFGQVPQVPSGPWVTLGGALWRLGHPRIS